MRGLLGGDVTDQPHSRVKGGHDDADNKDVQSDATNTVTNNFSPIILVRAAPASTDTIVESSDTYDAYGVHRSLERMSVVAKRVWHARAAGSLADCELGDLRAALFMTQRGWRSYGSSPGPDVGLEWELVSAINEASGGLVPDGYAIVP